MMLGHAADPILLIEAQDGIEMATAYTGRMAFPYFRRRRPDLSRLDRANGDFLDQRCQSGHITVLVLAWILGAVPGLAGGGAPDHAATQSCTDDYLHWRTVGRAGR